MLLVVTLKSVTEDSRPDRGVYDKLSIEDMLLLPALHVIDLLRQVFFGCVVLLGLVKCLT